MRTLKILQSFVNSGENGGPGGKKDILQTLNDSELMKCCRSHGAGTMMHSHLHPTQ